jgi:hypothetical protein
VGLWGRGRGGFQISKFPISFFLLFFDQFSLEEKFEVKKFQREKETEKFNNSKDKK